MLDLIVLNGAACASGSCAQAQQVVSASYVLAPQVVAVAQAVPGKTVVKYRRNIFGQMKPVYAEVASDVAAVSSSGSKSSCKGNCK